MKSTTNKTLNRKILSIYWQHTKPYKKQLAIIYPSMVVAQIIEDFVQPIIISGVLTTLASGNIDEIKSLNIALIFCAVILTETTGHLIWNRIVVPIFWKTQDKIMVDLNMTCFSHLQSMSSAFFNDRFAGSLVNQVNKLVGSYERLTDALTWNVFKLIVSIFATTIILAPKAPFVSLSILIISTIFVPLMWRARQKQLPFNRAWAEAETARTGQLADSISNVITVKSFTGEQYEKKRMQERVNEVHRKSLDTMRVTLDQELITGSVQRSINIAVIVIAIALARNGRLDVGIIYLSLTFTMGIMRRLWDLGNTFRTLTRVFGDAGDMAEILDMEPEVRDVKTAVHFEAAQGAVTFKDVKFSHDNDENLLFNGFDLEIKPGEHIGLVGQSGGGKTTITQLLMRLMDIQSGEIKIDGQDISQVTQSQLRQAISYVPQESALFHRSLSENIAYGKPRASDAEIMLASKMAHAHEFIKDLPTGYETLVGERGVKLSGGQRQRIAIARAMIKDAPILVLDEATSALDSESEKLIQDALWKLMEGRTTIAIAHRLSTIQKMDRIIVLDKGKIAEQGSHKQLLKQGGIYANLWSHQSGGFIED
ncbi:ABC transporter ATP-binding protein [Candidatus Saccharibacteria bacterium]|nr:ABC transporter ATP-binding protein [Candidatus Saccharibacteria bacterium]